MRLSDKTVVVTGAGGFIGGHLVEKLHQMGCRIRVLISYRSSRGPDYLGSLSGGARRNFEIVKGDIRDRGSVARVMEEGSVVFHLAGLGEVSHSFEAPESYVATNVTGTMNILEEARRNNFERVILTSTAAVYGRPTYLPLDEAHPLKASSPYGSSKICAEVLGEGYYRSYGTDVTTVRPFNTYGPGQITQAIIPSVIKQLLGDGSELEVGDLSPSRDMVYVADMVTGFIKLAESDRASGEIVNIASGLEVSMRQIVEALVKLMKPSVSLNCDPSPVQSTSDNQDRVCGSNQRLRELTGWVPETGLDEGLKRTVDWFQAL